MALCTTYKNGESATLDVILNEDYFPEKYIVYNNGEKKLFPGTKKGAREAKTYYKNISSIIEYGALKK